MLPLTRKALIALLFASLGPNMPVLAQEDAPPAEPADEGSADAAGGEAAAVDVLVATDEPLAADLRQLAADAAKGDWNVRRAAQAKLAGEYGGRAVAALLHWIGSDADVDARVQAITALKRLGGDSIAAMIAGLGSSDAAVRRNLALTLGELGASEAAAALMRLSAVDPDPLTRSVAAEALARVGGQAGGDPSNWLTTAATQFLDGTRQPVAGPDGKHHVYFWNGRRVMDREASPAMWAAANAKLAAEQAVALAPASSDAQNALVAAYGAMDRAAGSGDDVGPGGWEKGLPRVRDLLRLGGAIADTPAVDAPGAETLDGAAELIRSPDKRLRYKAALALASSTPSADVVATLGDAITESATRQIVVISNDPAELNALIHAAKSLRVSAVGAGTGAQGIMRAKESPSKDAVVVRSTVRDVSADRIADILKRDVRTADVPVIVIVDEADRERMATALGDKVTAVVPAPANADILKPAFEGAFEKKALNDERMQSEQFSQRAALALAALDGSVLGPASNALLQAIDREDKVRVPALIALSKLGAPEAEGAALKVMRDATASAEARLAAAAALRGILANAGGNPDTLRALEAAARGGAADPTLRSAACAALGGAKALATEKRSALLLELSLPF